MDSWDPDYTRQYLSKGVQKGLITHEQGFEIAFSFAAAYVSSAKKMLNNYMPDNYMLYIEVILDHTSKARDWLDTAKEYQMSCF